jgi:hypothetical protein
VPPEDKREKKMESWASFASLLIMQPFGGKGGKDMLGLFNIIGRSLSLSFFLLDYVLRRLDR